MKIAAGGGGGRAPDLRGPELFGNEVDDALLGLEDSGDALGGPGLLAADDEADVAPAGATQRRWNVEAAARRFSGRWAAAQGQAAESSRISHPGKTRTEG